MADLNTLSQQAPFAGAFGNLQAQGIQNDQAVAETQRLQGLYQQLQQQMQQDAAMNPLRQQELQLKNQTTQADLPGVAARASLDQTHAKIAADTIDSATSAADAKNRAQAVNDSAQVLSAAALAAKNANGPGGAAMAMDQFFKSHGIGPDHSLYQTAMQYTNNPDQLIQLSDSMIKHSAPYMQAMDVEGQKAAASKYAADQQLKGEQVRAAAGIKEAQIHYNVNSGDLQAYTDRLISQAKGDPERSYSIYTNAAQLARVRGMDAEAEKYDSLAAAQLKQVNARLAARQPLPGVDINGVAGVPVVPRVQLEPNTPPAAPATPPVAAPASQAQRLPPNVQSVADVRKLSPAYANLSDDQLKQAIKTKFGVDLK